jgi:hypothetical protein
VRDAGYGRPPSATTVSRSAKASRFRRGVVVADDRQDVVRVGEISWLKVAQRK